MPCIRGPVAIGIILAGILLAGEAPAQCLLANPSFELPGSGGAVFGGWNQFGAVGSSPEATHGHAAARVSGPNTGNWDVSAFWQPLDTAPGDRWTASVKAWHTPIHPLSGSSSAILNIEWRDSGGNLISYESHTVADASTPTDQIQNVSILSQPAPTGAVTTHFLLGVLQSPTDPVPDVYYDQATFVKAGPPTLDDIQWNDFPGGRSLVFAGRTWRVKGPGYYGPGPNLFSDSSACTWVDGEGRLHLTIRQISGSWYSTEVTLEESLGYGDYIFTTLGPLDAWHPDVVLGLFLWQYGPCYDPAEGWWNPNNEADVEFSRWGDPQNDVGQFVVQPFDYPGNIDRFDVVAADGELTSQAIRWTADGVECRSWRGGPGDESPSNLIHSWSYTGPQIPRPEQPRVHINLWQFNGPPDVDQEAVIEQFTFVPADSQVVGIPADLPSGPKGLLGPVYPNPFGPRTTITFTLPEEDIVELSVYDVSGRRVRSLFRGPATAGDHIAAWDGRNDSGLPVASGIYLVRLRTGRVVETRRLSLLR